MILPAGLEIGWLEYLDFLIDFVEISQDEIVSCHESNTHWYFLRHFFWLKFKQKVLDGPRYHTKLPHLWKY